MIAANTLVAGALMVMVRWMVIINLLAGFFCVYVKWFVTILIWRPASSHEARHKDWRGDEKKS